MSVASTSSSGTSRQQQHQQHQPRSPKERMLLSSVEETLLAGVWCRAQDAASPRPLLGDPYAQPTLDRCDVDYERTTFSHLHDERFVRLVSGRGRALDAWCRTFLQDAAGRGEAVQVLHAGCGLDSRALRVRDLRCARGGPSVRWIDLDTPMVIHLRERLFVGDWAPSCGDGGDGGRDGEGGGGGGDGGEYLTRSLSVTHPSWLRDILQDRRTLVIAEGLLMYLKPEEAHKVVRDVVEYFGAAGGGKGGEIIFDTLGTIMQRKTEQVGWLEDSGARFSWGVDDPREVEALHPGLRLVESQPWYQYMNTERKASCSPPWFGPLKTKVAALNSSYMDFAHVMRFEF